MTPPNNDNWRHQALSDVEDNFEKAHKRIRESLKEEEDERKDLERKMEMMVKNLRDEIKNEYLLTKVFDKAFDPVQRGFYGTVGLILTTVILSILYLVLKK